MIYFKNNQEYITDIKTKYKLKNTSIIIIIALLISMNSPTSLSQASSQNIQDIDLFLQSIIRQNKTQQKQNKTQNQNSPKQGPSILQQNFQQKQLEEVQLQMLVEQCQDLIAKISPGMNQYFLQDQTTFMSLNSNSNIYGSQADQTFTMKRQKNRLEKQYIQLCLEIQRQQKQLQNYRFKVQVAHREADYYSRQIKQKTSILENLEKHASSKKKPVRR